MPYIWTPSTSLFESIRDNETNVLNKTGEAVRDPTDVIVDPITGEETVKPDPNQFTVSGLSNLFTFSTSGNTFTVYTNQVPFLFPIRVTYLETRYKESQKIVTSWADVPAGVDVIKLETIASSPVQDSFTVTASYNGTDPESKTYYVKIIHVYTANKNTLQARV